MSVATSSSPALEMRAVSTGRVSAPGKQGALQSLVISPNLDALLEHDERVRRAQQGGTWSSMDSPGYASPTQGLPPPPRRARVPGSPQLFSPPAPRSPIITQTQEERVLTPVSVESNPYINPAPQWIEQPRSPISPPPRTSSMGVDMDSGRRSSLPVSTDLSNTSMDTTSPRQSHGRSPSTSASDSRVPPFTRTPSLPRIDRLLKRSSPNEPVTRDLSLVRKRSRSRGKLVKRDRDRDSGGSSQNRDSQTQPSSPQMSEILETPRVVRRQRSSRSISVSSAISTDRESFIDLFSPSNQDFPSDLADTPFLAASPSPSSRPKPPIPTTPKPDFTRRSVVVPRRPSPVGPPAVPVRAIPPDTMPPTTNFLNPTERAQLIKKSRKLAQVFGQTPGAADFLPDARSSFLEVSAPSNSKARHRPAASMNMIGQMPPAQRPLPPWPAPDKTIHMTVHGRRHSISSAPASDEAQTVSLVSGDNESSSPRSFMDFSNSNEDADVDVDVGPDDSISVAGTVSASAGRSRSRIPASPSSPSLFENLSPEEQAEEERRKKRDKLAKLHRFLGSRVPTSLVLGSDYLEAALPPPVVALDGTLAMSDSESRRGTWAKRRRSSSAAVLSSWSDDLDRLKEDLNDKEKAIIVRRAQKMEKVFGVAPPQKLYNAHLGHASGASTLSSASGARTVPSSPGGTPPSTPPASFSRNPNQAPYKRKSTSRRARPSTGDSDKFLLAHAEPSAGSFVYTHYQHSLNSLHDILDRNDKESLAELHQYLNDASADDPPISPLEFARETVTRPTLTKLERRRSLPARTSMASLASIASASSISSIGTTATATLGSTASTPDADTSEFQQRRRRAAKLTQFFGVDYRDLIEDVLESIEHGLDAERKRGTLNHDEAEDLLQKLRTLKTRR